MKLIALALMSSLAGCVPHVVDAGHVGVQVTWGEVQPDIHPEGLYWVQLIGERMHDYDVRIQKLEANASASSKDLQVVTTTVAVNYRPDSSQAALMYQKIGDLWEVESKILAPAVQEAVKKTTAQFTAEELITKRQDVKRGIAAALSETMAESSVLVTELSITNFQFDQKYQAAVEAKQVAEQKALTAKNDLRRIEVEAQQAEAAAKGRANAMLVEAEAEAKAQEMLREVLTDEVVQLRAVEKWDGKLPVVGGDSGAFVDVSGIAGLPSRK